VKVSPQNDTIAALATAQGQGGIAVVRVSGPLAPEILKRLFQKQEAGSGKPEAGNAGRSFPASCFQPPVSEWKSHRLAYGKLVSPGGDFLDQCLAVWMKAPRSFTGEEVVEFHLHGGPLVSLKVLEAAYGLGARPAQAGEFTQRAFLNGKIDLAQAEAVADMIAAQSDRALKLAQAQWQGALSRPVQELRHQLFELLVHLEAAIDFPEEEIEILDRAALSQRLEGVLRQLEQWSSDYELGRLIREGPVVVLLGKPNVGKSSLLNFLCREEAAIVHSEPGTTRDAIERVVHWEGMALRLIDTAGIREGEGEVERMGIERSRRWYEKAHLILALFDGSSPWNSEDGQIAELASKKKCLMVVNKSDLPASDRRFSFPKDIPTICISAKTGEGIRDLQTHLLQLLGVEGHLKENTLLLNQLRHKESLEKAQISLQSAYEGLQKSLSPEFVATDTMAAAQAIGEIIGEVTTDHILEDIFNRFCIGK